MQIPETQTPTQDLLALITTAHGIYRQSEGKDGNMEMIADIDNEGIFWQTQNVSSPVFGLFVKEYKDLESLQHDCYNHMPAQRARVFAEQLARACKSYRYSIEGKSSETVQDAKNNKLNLIDKIKERRTVHEYKVDEERKRNALAGLFGLDKESGQQG